MKATKIQSKPLNEQQIKDFVSFFKKNGSFPGSKIPCTVSGKLTTCIGPWMKKKIKEFGSAENLLRNYKCREVLKLEKQIIKPVSKTKKKTKKIENKDVVWDIPKIEFTPPRSLTSSEIQQVTESQCLRPDIFLTNGRHCEGCDFYENCRNSIKCEAPYTKKPNKKRK